MGYLTASVAVALATLVRAGLSSVLSAEAPLMIYILAITAGAYVGGFHAGLFATAAAAILGTFFFVEPQFAFGPITRANLVQVLLFVVTGTVVSWLVERMHHHYRVAQKNERAAYDAVQHGIHMLNIVSHELRNPLAAIHGALAARSAPDGALDDRSRGVIQRQANYLTYLVNDLLDTVGIERGGIVVSPAPVPLAAVVERAVELAEPSMVERRQVLRVDLPSRDVIVHADPIRLQQVFSNVLLNASKYTPAGGHIDVSVDADERSAMVRVRDDGVGLSSEHAARIFEPYFRASEDRRGLGLGLFIAKHLIEKHGGRIDVESDGPGRGTTFAVHLPMRSAA